jgi:hypothetical protein
MYRFLTAAAALTFASWAGIACAGGTGAVTGRAGDTGKEPRTESPGVAAVPEVTEDLSPEVREAILDHAALALATAIRESRRQALERGVSSIPPRIRAELEPYFPAGILDNARWTTAGGISLDGMLKSWFALDGAITLGEVIAFSDDVRVQKDVELWAHELTHVMQYEQLGIETFASQYVRDYSAMESEASSNASRIMADVAATQ